VYLVLTDARGSGDAAIAAVHADSGRLIFTSPSHTLSFGSHPLAIRGLVFRIRDVVFPEPGLHWVEFRYNGKVLARQLLLGGDRMTEPAAKVERPVLTEIVDELIEFTDNAIPDSTGQPLASPAPALESILTDEIDELVEFTDSAGKPADEANGAAQGKVASQAEPAV
jgi:hypothetical protein